MTDNKTTNRQTVDQIMNERYTGFKCICGESHQILTHNHVETVHYMTMDEFIKQNPDLEKYQLNICATYNCTYDKTTDSKYCWKCRNIRRKRNEKV